MKNKIYLLSLILFAVLGIALNFIVDLRISWFSAVTAFPFQQLGYLLRVLSLSSTAGNIAAILLLVLISLIPVMLAGMKARHHRFKAEDLCLLALSPTLAMVLYLMVNPGYIAQYMGGAAMLAAGRSVLGITIYSLLIGYLVIRLLRLFLNSVTTRLLAYLIWLLRALNMLFVFQITGVGINNLLSSFQDLRAGNTGQMQPLTVSYVFLVMQSIVDLLPWLMNILIVFAVIRLLQVMAVDRYSTQTAAAAESLTKLCSRAIVITITTSIIFNLLQLIFMQYLLQINSAIQIPLTSLIFVLAVLLTTQLLRDNRQLKQDQDLFI